MIVDNVLEVIYAPRKALKRIAANPKYISAILVIILFIGLQIAFEYQQFSNVYTEQTSPVITALPSYITASNWNSNANVSNNFGDDFNYTIYTAYGYYPNLFGNSSLEFSAQNTNNVQAGLTNVSDGFKPESNVDCSEVGYQNLSMIVKMVEPQTAPLNATLTLYTLTSDTNYYQYDLTPTMSNLVVGQWNNLTIPVGKTASGWTATGIPSWSNITSLTLGFTYPDNSNVTIHIGAMFFRGQFLTPTQQDSTGLLLNFLNRYSLDILFSWFLITGLMFLLLKALKVTAVWKPLFIGAGCVLIVMVIRSIVSLAAAATLSAVYYPFDALPGVGLTPWGTAYYPQGVEGTLFASSQAVIANISESTSIFNYITGAMFVFSYVWLGVLGAMLLGAINPDLSAYKRAIISTAAIVVTVLVLIFLVVGVA